MTLSPINDRIFYACQAVYTNSRYTTQSGGTDPATDCEYLKGVQSVGVSKESSRETYLDIGRFQREYGSYGKTTFSITISRVIHKAGDFFFNVSGQTAYEDAHILNDTNGIGHTGIDNNLKNYDILLLYTLDTKNRVNSGLTSPSDSTAGRASAVIYRCCLLTNISYSIPVQGPVTENLTFTTNFYEQLTDDRLIQYPISDLDSEETVKRQDIVTSSCVFPAEVTRMFDLSNSLQDVPILGLQNIDIECNINYQDLTDIGMWRGSANSSSTTPTTGLDETGGDIAEQNIFKVVQLPVEVSCTFQGILRDQYDLNASAAMGDYNVSDVYHTKADGGETPGDHVDIYRADREIKIIAEADGANLFQWHLGAKNYLTSLDVSGGDAGGGNVEGTVSFQNDHSEIFLLKDSTIQTFSTNSIY